MQMFLQDFFQCSKTKSAGRFFHKEVQLCIRRFFPMLVLRVWPVFFPFIKRIKDSSYDNVGKTLVKLDNVPENLNFEKKTNCNLSFQTANTFSWNFSMICPKLEKKWNALVFLLHNLSENQLNCFSASPFAIKKFACHRIWKRIK